MYFNQTCGLQYVTTGIGIAIKLGHELKGCLLCRKVNYVENEFCRRPVGLFVEMVDTDFYVRLVHGSGRLSIH